MTIVEIGRENRLSDRTTPTHPFVRKIQIGPATVSAGLLSIAPGLDLSNRQRVRITGIRDLPGNVYEPKTSIEDVYDDQQSFFWSQGQQILYFHLPHTENPFSVVLISGLSEGFSDVRLVYIDDVEFLPMLVSTPTISQQQDIENYDMLAFVTGLIEISNQDGSLDGLIDQPIYGNSVLLYYLPGNESNYTGDDLQPLASLFVEDYDLSTTQLRLRARDRRKSQNIVIPSLRFSSADYPDALPEIINEVVPVIWGQPREIPAIVTNGELTAGNVKYRAGLLLTDIGTVQIETTSGTWETATPVNVNLSTGEFELVERDSSGQPYPTRLVSPIGIQITRLTDIIKDINDRYLSATYNSSNYDTGEWELEELAISTGALYLDRESTVFQVIREIQNGANVGFRYEILPDGRRTIRVDDEGRTAVGFVDKVLIQNRNNLTVETNSRTLIAEVVVKYGLSYQSGRWLRVIDDGSADDVLSIYQQKPRREYDSLLQTEALAQEKALYLRERFDRIRGIGRFILMGGQFLSLRIYDIIEIEISLDESRIFFGKWRAKVLSVSPNPRAETNTITAVLTEKI